MKRVTVRLEYVYELPDHARLEEPVDDGGQMLFLHGRFLQPEVSWMALSKIGEGEGAMTQEGLADELEQELMESCTAINLQRIEVQDAG